MNAENARKIADQAKHDKIDNFIKNTVMQGVQKSAMYGIYWCTVECYPAFSKEELELLTSKCSDDLNYKCSYETANNKIYLTLEW